MLSIQRTVVIGSLGLGFLLVGAGAAPASQCNADPGYDPSHDPIQCQYANPLPSSDSIGAPEKTAPAPAPAEAPKKK